MNFLNDNLKQLQQLFLSMSNGARITSAILLVAIVVSLVYLFQYQVSAGDTYIYGGREFSQAELAAMEDALSKSGLNQYELVGYRIRVPRSKRDEYTRAIAEQGATPKDAYELDNLDSKFNPLMGREQQRLMAKTMEQRRLAGMIMDMQGIQTATPMISETVSPGFPRTVERSAVVTVKAEGSRALTESEIRSIRRIVVNANAGMKESQVSIVDQNTSEEHTVADDTGQLLPEKNPYVQMKKYYEDELRKKIVRRLAEYSPNVEVFAELDPTLRQVEAAKTLDTTPVVISQNSETRSSRSTDPELGGTPGVPANNPASGANGTASVAASAAKESVEDRSSESTESTVGGRITEIATAGLVLKGVTVSIGIPRSFYEKLWVQKNPVAEGEEVPEMPQQFLDDTEIEYQKLIQEIVRPMIPKVGQGEDIYQNIAVETDPVFEPEPILEPSTSDHALAWLAGNWQTVGMFMLGLVGVVMLRGMVKSATKQQELEDEADAEELAIDAAMEATQAASEEDVKAANKLKRRFGTTDKSLREELTELVEDDVDAAANVLRSWIGDAA